MSASSVFGRRVQALALPTLIRNLLLLLSLSLCSLKYCQAAGSAGLVYQKYRNLCGGNPIIQKKHNKSLQWLLKNAGESALLLDSAPQHEAACWMLRESSNFTPQRYVLGVLYYATQGVAWEINTNWMTNKHECKWYGVKCNIFKSVTSLDLGFIKVDGLIPRELGLLSNLEDIDLHGNDLQGVIPHKFMAGLKKLKYLRLHMNGMFGAIHKEIANMVNLKEIHLFGNYMGGTLPRELSKLKNLEVLDLYANMLEGKIPSELAAIPKLRYLDLHDNNFIGTMPKEICQRKLDVLAADCHGSKPEVKCDCCTVCCQGLPKMICVDQKTGQLIDLV